MSIAKQVYTDYRAQLIATKQMMVRLLACAELNQDDLESETELLLEDAHNSLAVSDNFLSTNNYDNAVFGDENLPWEMIREVRDNEGQSIDRYTVVYVPVEEKGYNDARSMSHNPKGALGVCYWDRAQPGDHLGKKISFHELPEDCREIVLQDLAEMM